MNLEKTKRDLLSKVKGPPWDVNGPSGTRLFEGSNLKKKKKRMNLLLT